MDHKIYYYILWSIKKHAYVPQDILLKYWHQRADESHGNLPQVNQELLVVRNKVRRHSGELGVSKSMECDIFPFSALTLLVG